MRVEEILRREHVGLLDGKHFVDEPPQRFERGLDLVAAIGRGVAMEDLLEDLAARDQPPPLTGQPFEGELGVDLVGMWLPHQVHEDVRVEVDHTSAAPASPASISARRPASVSASIVSMSTSLPPIS